MNRYYVEGNVRTTLHKKNGKEVPKEPMPILFKELERCEYIPQLNT